MRQFLSLYETFRVLRYEEFFATNPAYSDYDGPNVAELQEELKFITDTVDGLKANDALRLLSWHAFNGLQGPLQNAYNTLSQLITSRDQGSFQNAATHVDSLVYHIRMFQLPYLASGGAQLEATQVTLSNELERLLANNRDAETLKSEVKNLIAPAVAGSLSKAFTERRDTLINGRITWGVIAFLIGAVSIYATFEFVSSISAAMLQQKPPAGEGGSMIWSAALIRSAILLPLFAAFGFAFSQYKKERDFEEEYAHKAAVAISLPNYGDLTREPSVRDQIVTGATNVIFNSPTARSKEGEKLAPTISGLKEVVDAIAKLLPHKG